MNTHFPTLIQVETTTPNQEVARQLADELLSARLAACIQIIGPMESHFVWEGVREQQTEYLFSAKTVATAYASVAAKIRDIHPYDEPEVLSTEIQNASEGYMKWVVESVTHPDM